jgi:dihydropyrimidine dehydrogenase (NADP+)
MEIYSIYSFSCFFWWFPRVSLQYFTTHTDLVQRQQEAIKQRKAIRKGLQSDKDWTGDGFVKESESMVSN